MVCSGLFKAKMSRFAPAYSTHRTNNTSSTETSVMCINCSLKAQTVKSEHSFATFLKLI